MTTSEPISQYLADSTLLNVGDWAFPNIHPWIAGIRSIPDAVQFVQNQDQALRLAAPGRTIVVKKAWWPTGGGDTAATEANQTEYFRQLANTSVKFVWGETYDQFWKTAEGSQGPHWGFHTDQSRTKGNHPGLTSRLYQPVLVPPQLSNRK